MSTNSNIIVKVNKNNKAELILSTIVFLVFIAILVYAALHISLI